MKSVGEILKTQRKKKKFELSDIHKFIKIHPKFLKALEEDDYSIFSNKVHAKGFLKVYADFLELNVDQILALWRREYGGQFDEKQKTQKEFKLKEIDPPKFLVTPGVILITIATILVFGFFGFLFYQYRNYSGVPDLKIHTPENNVVVNSETLDITGETDRDSVVLINNQRIVVGKDGSFATSIKLHEGINTLSFLAVNKLGRESEEVRTIIYRKPVEEGPVGEGGTEGPEEVPEPTGEDPTTETEDEVETAGDSNSTETSTETP